MKGQGVAADDDVLNAPPVQRDAEILEVLLKLH